MSNLPGSRYLINARFWAYVNGSPVKITLKPGQSLEWYSSRSHDEGWSGEGHTWEYDDCDGLIVDSMIHEGADCDGRHGDTRSYHCDLFLLQHGSEPGGLDYCDKLSRPAWNGVVWPKWELAGSRAYDQYAESMNY